MKGLLSFVCKRKHCPNHVFDTIPCLQFDPLLRPVKKINNLALYRYSLDARSLRYIISSCVLMLFHVEGYKFSLQAFEMYLGQEQCWEGRLMLGLPYIIFIVYKILFRGI